MRILREGNTGASVELLQLALDRAGFGPLIKDGIFGTGTKSALTEFQKSKGLLADGIAGANTNRALLPWYTGFLSHTVSEGDTIFDIAQSAGTTVEAIVLANPGISPRNLHPGATLVVPLSFPVVPTNISCGSQLVLYCVRGLSARYPFISTGEIGKSVMGRPIWRLNIGIGANRVLYNASHHANEWITSLILLKYIEDLASAFAYGGKIFSESAAELISHSKICFVPAVNPDGMDLVTGDINGGEFYTLAERIATDYPQFSFPQGWKANIRGTDLNLQYPAGWEQAREIKFGQGIVSPAPADFVGNSPLCAPESRAMYDFTRSFDPRLILAYHTQGEVIFWRYLDYEPVNSRRIAQIFSEASGYALEETPYASGFAGYKDWFIQDYVRPGYTIEAGLGVNPLPLSDFDKIYSENTGILTFGALVT